MPQPWRFAVVGLGQRIAAVLRAIGQAGAPFEVIGYADPQPVGLPLMREWGIGCGKAFASVDALLAAGPYDLVLIGSPNHLHLTHLEAAVASRAPVFIEKPIVRTEAESLAVARLLARKDLPPVYVGLVLRSAPLVREVLALIDGGAIGRVVSIDATEHLPPEHGAYLARNWRRAKEWGGSFLLDKVCHDFDVFQRIAGARAARVASFGGRSVFTDDARPDALRYNDGEPAYNSRDAGWQGADDAFASGMDVADHQVAVVEYANGVRLSFHSNSHAALIERRWYIAGTEGTLIADVARNTLMWRRALDKAKPQRRKFESDPGDGHNGADIAMAHDLIAALQGRAAFPVRPGDAVDAGLTVMAIDRAMEEGRVVDLGETWRALGALR